MLDRTGGLGADHVFLAAGGDSNGPVELAARLARDRARVVDIGKTRLDLPWNAYYEKELDVRFSRSYGPGRYDDRYELEGVDYPRRLRALDRAPQPRLLPRPARRRLGRRRRAGLRRPPDRRRRGGVRGLRDGLPAGRRASCSILRVSPRVPAGDPARRSWPRRAGRRRPRRRPRGGVRRAARLRRRGQLRVLDAAAPPRDDAGVDAGLGRDDPVAVGGQRPAQVRLRDDHDRRRRRARRPGARRRLRRHPAPLARGLRLPGARARQGGLRREAAGAHRAEVARILDAVERTGNDRLMVGFNRRFAPLFAELRRPLRQRRRPGDRALPGQRRAAGRRQLVPRRGARGLPVRRRGRPLHRHRERVDRSRPGRGARRWDARAADLQRHAALRRRLRWPRSPTCTDGDPRFPRRRSTSPAAAATPGSTTSPASTVWAAGARDGHRVLAGQDKGQRAQLEAVRRRGPARGRHADRRCESLVATTRATLAVGEQPGVRQAGDPVSRPGPGWYLRRLRADVARRGGSSRGWTSGAAGAWARRQVRPGEALAARCRGACRLGPFAVATAAGAPARGAARGRGRGWSRPPTRLLAGDWESWAHPDRQSPTRTGSSTRSPGGGRRPARWRSASTTATRP